MPNSDRVVKLDTFAVTIKDLVDDYVYRIDLDAEYQREKIWALSDQRLLLDSILNDIDIPKLYLAKVDDNKQSEYECIDGKQRMVTLLTFFKPEHEKGSRAALTLPLFNREFTYEELKREHPKVAEKIDNYKLDFVCYELGKLDDASAEKLIREVFRRLQLGIRLNPGERLKALQGTIRDFVFKEMGNVAPFLRNTGLSPKRFSREFTLAQICLNSFERKEEDEFVRTRLLDLEDFFNEKASIDQDDPNLHRIREVLQRLDTAFGANAINISSRAVAVSAYLFAEGLYLADKTELISIFAFFYLKLLGEITRNMEFIRKYKSVENREVMEGFQKYILQASVEPSAIRRRNDFLRRSFAYFVDPATKGKLFGTRS